MDASIFRLGLGDWSVAAAFYLNVIGALFCVGYAFYAVAKGSGDARK
ncbi:MAG: hypothetical protein AB7F40_11055 [Victivallaceae bacterium]|nr:hypothetical protein [Victivallaceae bacterium]